MIETTPKPATPLMQQYLRLKEKYKDEVLFFRLGDFYEMFFDDAVRAAPLLEVTLTQRQSIPMCGIPYHASAVYLAKLLKLGHSVAIAEQLDDPKKTKGMVRRDVVRVMTPGTLIEDALLPATANNFLLGLVVRGQRWGLAAVDVSTGQRWEGELDDQNWTRLKSQLAALDPSEILLGGDTADVFSTVFAKDSRVRFETLPPNGVAGLGAQAQAMVEAFLSRQYPAVIPSLQAPQPLPAAAGDVLFLDQTAIRHLELVEPSEASSNSPTLLSVINKTVTPMGGRLLRWRVLNPSCSVPLIKERQDQLDDFLEAPTARAELREQLREMPDYERIHVRIKSNTVSPRELASLRHGLKKLTEVRATLNRVADERLVDHFASFNADLTIPAELIETLDGQLSDEPPAKVIDGGVMREGVSPELDELRTLRRHGKKWIAEMEAAERERTGISTLKVGYNEVFGYFLEVSKSNIAKVPSDWHRKQTMTNGERYITPALKEQEEKILGAEEKILALESRLFAELVHHVGAFGPTLAKAAQALAALDVAAGLADVAATNGYIRPVLTDSNSLRIKGGRHPVIENHIGREQFIPNDVAFDAKRILIITGPNMAGKSTYLRQAALLVILAQMGSFVPAEEAEIGIVDKIFTRIGAADRLSQGQSTFMVEMQEVANLMANATPRSLLVLDEVGRGTSTYDGLSIAWAVIEHLSNNGAPRTLFATHYFELTQLADKWPAVANAHATAKEWSGQDGRKQVVFLYQIKPGAADRSYGIHVAEMAGVPVDCIKRAREILSELESKPKHDKTDGAQLQFFEAHPMIGEIEKLNLDHMTPMEAFTTLSELKAKFKI